MDREVIVYSGESCNKIIFERLNCMFCLVSSAQVGWNKLEAFFFFSHDFLRDFWALVVEVVLGFALS